MIATSSCASPTITRTNQNKNSMVIVLSFHPGVSQQHQPHQQLFIQQQQAQPQSASQHEQQQPSQPNFTFAGGRKSHNNNNNDVPITPMGTNLDARLNLLGLQTPNSLLATSSADTLFPSDSKASTSQGRLPCRLLFVDVSSLLTSL